MLVIFHRLS